MLVSYHTYKETSDETQAPAAEEQEEKESSEESRVPAVEDQVEKAPVLEIDLLDITPIETIVKNKYGENLVDNVLYIDDLSTNIEVKVSYKKIINSPDSGYNVFEVGVEDLDGYTSEIEIYPNLFGNADEVRDGAAAVLTITPAYDYRMGDVISDGSPIDKTEFKEDGTIVYTISNIDEDTMVTQEAFKLYDITVKEEIKDELTANTYKAINGEEVSVSVQPGAGYRFVEWVIAGKEGEVVDVADEHSENTTFTMIGNDVDLYAKFVNIYNINLTNRSGGTITSDVSEAAAGEIINLKASVKSSYRFNYWEIKDADGNKVESLGENGTVNSFIMPEKEVNVTANYTYTRSRKPSGPSYVPAPVEDPSIVIIEETKQPLGNIKFSEPYIIGYEDGTFRPNNLITRAEVASIFARILELDAKVQAIKYEDVPKSHWAYNSIQQLSDLGILNGYDYEEDGIVKKKFLPEDPITNGEASSIIAAYWSYAEIEVDDKTSSPRDITGHWAEKNINKLYNAGVMANFNKMLFKPDEKTTRTEIVEMINMLLNRKRANDVSGRFSDVTPDTKFYQSIESASSKVIK